MCMELLEIVPGYFPDELHSTREGSISLCVYANALYYMEKEDNPECTVYDFLKFDYDWNYIHEVITEVEKLKYLVIIQSNYCCIQTIRNSDNKFKSYIIAQEHGVHEGKTNTMEAKRNAVVRALYLFLKWYKQNK